MHLRTGALALALILTACQQSDDSVTVSQSEVFDGITPEQTVRFTGTEPFWGGRIEQGMAYYSTPDDPQGTGFPIDRFAGLNGVSFSGMMRGERFDLMVTPGECSDGMSDRTYAYTATLMLGDQTREGCAWVDDAAPANGAME